jgi:hypothetical protein
MKNHESKSEIIIRGIVTPREWGADESIKSVSIQAEDEIEYLVEDSDKGKELLRSLQRMICATGTCTEDKNGSKYFRVKKYWLITESSTILKS